MAQPKDSLTKKLEKVVSAQRKIQEAAKGLSAEIQREKEKLAREE